jgi:dienelactone hydrolase
VFSEIYQGWSSLVVLSNLELGLMREVLCVVTGPVQRFARSIAGHGYIVAAPSSYHEFMGPEPLAYDGPGTDVGNAYKVQKVCPSTHRLCVWALYLLDG